MTNAVTTTVGGRVRLIAAILVSAFLVVGVAVSVLSVTGASPEPVPGLPTPGPLTEWGLPAARALRDLVAAGTIGLLVLAAVALPPDPDAPKGSRAHLQHRAVRAARLTALAWSLTGVAVLVLTYSDIAGAPITASGFASELRWFVAEFDLGRSLMVSVIITTVVCVGCAIRPSHGGVGFLALLSIGALWPLALTGHAAGSLNHATAVNLQFIHLVAISVWAGGLAALAGVLRGVGASVGLPVVRRYSTLAAWCLVLVALSGVGGAIIRVGSMSALLTPYGALILAKAALLTLLGAAGLIQRRRILQLAAGPVDGTSRFGGLLAKVVGLELLFLGLAIALGVALGRTPPPSAESGEPATATEALLGYAMPPALDAGRWLTAWRLDTLYTPLAVAALLWYVWSTLRLRRRGDRWNPGRTIAWTLGCLVMIWATSGAPAVYGSVLFSMHMVQHMAILTVVPPLLVLGAPVTLALRTLPRRTDGSRGPREWLLRLVHSLPMHLLGHPVFAAGNFVVSMAAFYYSGLFETSLRTHTGHVLMVAHFLITGYLFASVMCGVDPGPRRPAFPLRAILLLMTFGFHALFSVSLMQSTQVLAPDWFQALDRDWGRGLLDDQSVGAGFGWALGEAPLLLLAGAMFSQWVLADRRERARYDRQADRDDDQALAAYNAELARRGQHTERRHHT